MHPWRNVVMRSVNGSVGERADVRALSLAPGDRVLIASDGVTDLVAEPWIEEILARKQDDAAVESLIAAALGQGGRDNITCVLATVIDGPPVSGDGRLLGALADHTNVVDLAAVRALDSA
jgi:protein phosphatase